MLTIEILNSEDLDSIGEYQISLPSIIIGNRINCSLRVMDSELKRDIQIKVISNDRAYLVSNRKAGFLRNSKRYFLSTTVFEKDLIEFNQFKFKIIAISDKYAINMRNYRNVLIENLRKNSPENLEIIESIEEDLINLGIS